MHDAIYAQPGAIRLVTRANVEPLAGAAARLREMDRVWLAGIGTSWHAALVGELLLAGPGCLGARPRAIPSFELVNYWPAAAARTGVIVVSHRGRKRYSAEALTRARIAGGVGVAVTGKGVDALGDADFTLRTVEQEASATHTVSYTCALALLVALAAEMGAAVELGHALEALPDQLALLLGQESWEELTARFSDRRRWVVVGGGPNTATALEGALKLAEAAHVDAVGFNCEQFLHGPWAALEGDDVLVVVAPPGPSHARCVDAARIAREIGAAVLVLGREDDRELAALASATIALPETDELLSPLAGIVPLQLLAYHLAVRRGVDPDTLRAEEGPYRRAHEILAL